MAFLPVPATTTLSLTTLPKTDADRGMFVSDQRPPYAVGDKAVLHCKPGYTRPFAHFTSTVQQDGATLHWHPPEIWCNPVQCLPPVLPAHADASDTKFYFPHGFRFVCHDGYRDRRSSTTTYYCMTTGEWWPALPVDDDSVRCDPVECPPLRSPENGSVSSVGRLVFGAVASFRCDRNYAMLRGETQRTCRADGTWSGEDVVCDRIPCPPMPDTVTFVDNGLFHTVDCGNGKVVNVKCLATGQWSLPPPFYGCSGPPPNAFVLPPSPPPPPDPPNLPLVPNPHAADASMVNHTQAAPASVVSNPQTAAASVVKNPLAPFYIYIFKNNIFIFFYILLVLCLCLGMSSYWIRVKRYL